MYTVPEQLASSNKANIEALLTIANTAFASAERLAALNLNTARSILEDSVTTAKTLPRRQGRAGTRRSAIHTVAAGPGKGCRLFPQPLRNRHPDSST